MAFSNGNGTVKLLRIGRPDAAKHPERMKVHRLKVDPKRLRVETGGPYMGE